jgi:hypothetical protein
LVTADLESRGTGTYEVRWYGRTKGGWLYEIARATLRFEVADGREVE